MINTSEIIKYLDSKGKIKAALLFKLEKRFCNHDSKKRITETKLHEALFSMMQNRIIDILITDPFQISWRDGYLTDLKYFEDDIYLKRQILKLENSFLGKYKEDDYLFDSRSLNHIEALKELKSIIANVPGINKKIIIYLPNKSESLNIYEPYEGNYNLEYLDIKIEENIQNISKLRIPYETQKLNLEIIENYRDKFMCFYITLIEALQKTIVNLQSIREKNNDSINILNDFIRKFACYCIMFVRSDWVDLKNEPNPYRWETFFKSFDIPLRTIDIDFKSIKFHGRTFEAWNYFKFCIFIDKKYKEDIDYLKSLGYKELISENYNNFVAIGLNLETLIPCPSIEHFFFIYKYIVYYHLFRLFFHSFQYIKKIKKGFKFTTREENLYNTFLPALETLFGSKINDVSDKLVFKYYTYDSDELELIYNEFLMKNAKIIEKKLFSYFLIKYSKYNKKLDI